MKVFLVELETGVRIRDWVDQAILCDTTAFDCDEATLTCSARGGVYTRTLDSDMLVVTGVTQDGVALTEAATAALVDTTLSSWYFDPATLNLRVHLSSDSTAAGDVVLIAIVLELLARGRTLVKARSSGTALTWDGRVLELPSVSQGLTPDELGAGSVAALGALTLDNKDGRYDTLLGRRLLAGYEARIYRGEDTAAYSAFELWVKGLLEEPEAGAERVTLPLVSIAKKLDGPAITATFTTTAYPNMDAAITGFNIPKVWGSVWGAEAFRVASGRWKWADHAVTSVSTVREADGTAVTVDSTDHPNGEFTVNASYDTAARLYVDGVGYNLNKPGELITDVVQKLGSALSASDLDSTDLTALDSDRNVSLGFQVRTGSVREVLNLIAQSAFIDWFVDRTNLLSARARKRDQGNYVTNGAFETDASGWSGVNGATVSRTTSYKFRGAASLQVVKPAAQALAYAKVANLNLKVSTRYTVTMLAAVTSGTTTKFRLALTDSDGNEFLSTDVTLSATAWTRATLTTTLLANAVIFCDSTAVDCDSTAYDCDTEGGDLRVYPEYNGAGDVTVVIDEVEVVESILLDDTNAELLASAIRGPILWRVRAQYQFDGRTQAGRFSSEQDADIQTLYPTAESREVSGQLKASADADTVAQAVFDHFSAGRMRATLRRLAIPDAPLTVGGAAVLDLQTTRRPALPGDGRLFRLIGVDERHPAEGGSELVLEAEGLYDPIFDQSTIVAA